MKKTLAFLLAAALLLTACGGGGSSSNDTKYDTEVFKDFFISTSGEVSTWDYLNQAATVNTQVLVNLVSGLLDTDQYGKYVGDMADTWEHNDDYTVWTFHLKDNINWYTREGELYAPVVAQDWVTAIDKTLTQDANVCSEMARSNLVNAAEYHDYAMNGGDKEYTIEDVGVKALDDKTVEFTCVKSIPYFESILLYTSFFPVNADFLAEKTLDKFGNSPDNILYNGAYLMSEYENNSRKVYTANENYWDYDNVKIKTIEQTAVKDAESTKELFERGELSYCRLAGTQIDAEHDKENPYMYKTDPAACAYVLWINNAYSEENGRNALNNENFRKALFYGWDKTDYVSMTDPLDPESIFSYVYSPSDTFFTSDGTDYVNLPALKEWNQNLYDPEKGKDYMAKAKEELGDTVTYPVNFMYWVPAGNETATQSAEIFKSTMEEAFPDEITIEIKEYSQSSREEVMIPNHNSFSGAGWVPDYMDPVNVLFTWSLDSVAMNVVDETDGNGISHWNLPEFDALFQKADAETTDIDKRYELFAEAEAYLLEHAYFIPLYMAGCEYQMTSFNPYSRTYSKSGGNEYRYKLIDLYDHALTAEEVANFKAEWEEARKASN